MFTYTRLTRAYAENQWDLIIPIPSYRLNCEDMRLTKTRRAELGVSRAAAAYWAHRKRFGGLHRRVLDYLVVLLEDQFPVDRLRGWTQQQDPCYPMASVRSAM
jgi:hypothetical protein